MQYRRRSWQLVLEELEDWLDQNGPSWTVVLMQHARGERYVASTGRRYTGMDAVEHSGATSRRANAAPRGARPTAGSSLSTTPAW